ncbi:MAG: phosphotransferase family protein [Myxococcota bacterium]
MASDSIDLQQRFSGTQQVGERHRFDQHRLEEYLKAHISGFQGPLNVREFKGGQSNPTYRLTSPSGALVLRRKPPGVLLPSAHAVDREYRIISALNKVDFPVPRAHVLCRDESVIGTVFFIMECVEGRVLWDSLLPELNRDERREIYDSMNEVLARLHTIDFAALGLEDFGRPGNYFARQIDRWSRQYRASETEQIPEVDRLMEWLPENIPDDESISIVHGDYKLDNMITHPSEPRIIAVLDWELCTLGHPLGDLTYQLSQRRTPGGNFDGLDDERLRDLGIPTEIEYVNAYCTRTGRAPIETLDFYLAYNLFRTAAILQGIAGRVRDGTAASEHAVEMVKNVRPLARRAIGFARRLGA